MIYNRPGICSSIEMGATRNLQGVEQRYLNDAHRRPDAAEVAPNNQVSQSWLDR
jgi:hypothetical protein